MRDESTKPSARCRQPAASDPADPKLGNRSIELRTTPPVKHDLPRQAQPTLESAAEYIENDEPTKQKPQNPMIRPRNGSSVDEPYGQALEPVK